MSENVIGDIQNKLKAPKGQFNSFGDYYYRSCEDIVEAVKPILHEFGCHLNLTDEVVVLGDRYYVRATASIMSGTVCLASSVGWAREASVKKMMDESQITGSASSYARKYALNGLFAIDDTKDADTMDNSQDKDVLAWRDSVILALTKSDGALKEVLGKIPKDIKKKVWAEIPGEDREEITNILEGGVE